MPTKTRTRETIASKAARIMADPMRVDAVLDQSPRAWAGKVRGDSATYATFALSEDYKREVGLDLSGRVGCSCPAGRAGRLCSHALVAEGMRRRGER